MGFLWFRMRRPQPHVWSEPITIGGQEQIAGGIPFLIMQRTFRICMYCDTTDTMSRVRPWWPRNL